MHAVDQMNQTTAGQRLYVDRAKRMVVVNLAAYPEPRYRSAKEHDRDAELMALINSAISWS